jgi:DNA polymerase-3 subunit alpha
MRFQTPEFYLKSPAEMAELFSEVPDAVERSWEIAERCGIDFVFADDKGGKLNFPSYPIPADAGSPLEYLRRICTEGAVRRYGSVRPDVGERLEHELGVIDKLGFATYFLIVWDIVRNAKERGILVGPGRGSAAGSLVSYVLGITELDPLQYGLIFERFLNPGRKDPPDIDIDFPDDRRGEVVEYVMDKYGARNVSQIGTFSRMNARAVVRDVGRVLGMSYGEVDRLAKIIPTGPQPGGSSPHTLASGMETSEVKAALAQHEPYRRLCDIALSLEGLARHVSTHAAGIVIAPPVAEGEEGGLKAFVPLLRLEDDEYVTQYDMDGVKYLGLLKIDLLGLATLTVLDGTRKLVRAGRGTDIDFNAIPLDDAQTFALFAEGRTDGIFQFESSGMRDALRKLRPDRLEDLIALNALYRPGPMEQIDPFIKRARGTEKTVYDVPELEPILKATHGVIVYQEQVLQVVHQLAGYTLGEADDFRRSMGKKVRELMEKQEEMFVAKAKEKGISEAKAGKLFDFLEKFAGYGFNRSHSAAYALLAYWTAYLKTHYTVEFMAALLTSEMGVQDKVSEYAGECRKLGLKVHGPDVNRSLTVFSVEPSADGEGGTGGVRFGLAAIKNVGEAASEAVIKSRGEGGPFRSLNDFCERVASGVVNRKVMECLVRSGAFDSLDPRRDRLLAGLAMAMERGARSQEDREKGQESLFGASAIPEARPLPGAEQTPELNRLGDEKELLGCYVSGHPLAEYADDIRLFASHPLKASVLAELAGGTILRAAGIISHFKTGQTKQKKETYARFRLEDLDGSIEVLAWPSVLRKDGACLKNGSIVLLSGRLEKGEERASQLMLNDAMPLQEAPARLTREVHLRISSAGADEGLLRSLQEVAGNSPGEASLVLHFATLHHGEAVLEAGPSFRVLPTRELLSHLKALLGEDRVTLAGISTNGR